MRAPTLLLALTACGSSSSPTSQMQTLITSDWTLAPGTETHWCARKTIDHDMYLTEFDSIAPVGTHHSIVSMDTAPTIADNPGYTCTDPIEFAPTLLWGNGIGTGPFDYPAGVGVKIAAGTQVHLNLHLYNTSDSMLTGTSGIKVNSVAASAITNIARAEIDGIVSGGSVATGVQAVPFSCRLKSDVSLLATAPHMHKLGTHELIKVTPAGANAITLFDSDYSFETQEQVLIDPITQLHAGDTISFTCSYDNTTGAPVAFGQSSDNEMCVASFWFYPASASFCR